MERGCHLNKKEMNYNNKKFKAVSNSPTGEVEDSTIFHYYQRDNILWGTYAGEQIQFGTITGIVDEKGNLSFAYQHVNQNNEIMTGTCESKPELLDNGKIRLFESWIWTCKDCSSGTSIIEEI